MKTVTLILLCLLPLKVLAQCPVWKPDIRFEIDGASEMITLAWLGGWSSAVYEASNAGDLSLEVPECGYLISKQAVEILNAEFEGKTISAEKASAYIWPRLKRALSESPNN
tara:strand:+ start:399 stop:731 length:333 start_codon:yes stop_codon:yes gene_type:complete